MTKQKSLGLIALIIILAGGALFFKNHRAGETLVPPEETGTDMDSDIEISTTTPGATGQTSTLNHQAWTVLQTYLNFAHTHNLPGLKTVSYQLSEACTDPKQIDDCYKLMDTVYVFGSQFKEADFKNMWADSKQIILFTDLVKDTSDPESIGYTRGVIYFTRDSSGIKLLSFNPAYGDYVSTKGKDAATVEQQLQALLKDTDQDGLLDADESCVRPTLFICNKTDPKKRDTNGNGWWDGVEGLFYKAPTN